MSKAAVITLTADESGAITLLTRYEGGLDSNNPAHVAAAVLSERMGDIAEAKSERTWLTQEQVEAMSAAQAVGMTA